MMVYVDHNASMLEDFILFYFISNVQKQSMMTLYRWMVCVDIELYCQP